MIGHHYYRAGRRNAGAIRRVDLQFDSHLSEQVLQTKTLRRILYPPIEIPDSTDRSPLSGQAGKLRDAG
jgi:hypothetical protein